MRENKYTALAEMHGASSFDVLEAVNVPTPVSRLLE